MDLTHLDPQEHKFVLYQEMTEMVKEKLEEIVNQFEEEVPFGNFHLKQED